MTEPLHPKHGGRVLLELEDAEGTDVVYRTTLFTPSLEWRAVARIAAEGGAVSFAAWEGASEPPRWLVDAARAFLRSLYNARLTKDEPWPRRVLRWRPEK